MKEVENSELLKIRKKLENYAIYEIYDKEHPIIKNAVSWLKRVQHPLGFWGAQSPVETALALLALKETGTNPTETWQISEMMGTGGVNKARDWLIKNKDIWCSNIWDTSLILRVLVALGEQKGSETIRTLLDWLKSEKKK